MHEGPTALFSLSVRPEAARPEPGGSNRVHQLSQAMNQAQGSSREHDEEQQEPGQEAPLQTKPQGRSEAHPGDRGRGRTGDKLPTTKVLLGKKARHVSKIPMTFSMLIPASKILVLPLGFLLCRLNKQTVIPVTMQAGTLDPHVKKGK